MKLYRKRFIPVETVLLNDEVLLNNGSMLVTKWQTIKPRLDLASGVSVYWFDLGVKVSKFFDKDGTFLFYYCDIIEAEFAENGDIVCVDLLADVEVSPSGAVKVLDIGEVAEALESGLITVSQAVKALKSLDFLLAEIYAGRFGLLSAPIEDIR
ncbi:hypothetical protein FACS189490_09990 [Clostridia bacterium]|nr:hypothetical protein FACS189490_09990 [Clostridia bacterium]